MAVNRVDCPQVVETEKYRFERLGDGYVRFVAKAVAYGLEEAQEATVLLRAAHRAEGRRLRLIVDMRALLSFSRAARQLLQSDEQGTNTLATALMVDSGISRVVGNFIIGLNRGPIPTRLFTTEEEAREWLASVEER